MRDLDQFKRRLVQVALERLAAVEVAVRLLDHDMSLEQETFEHLLDIELGIIGVHGSERNVLQIEEHRHGCVGILSGH